MNKKNRAVVKLSSVHQFYWIIFGLQTVETVLLTFLSKYSDFFLLQTICTIVVIPMFYEISISYFNNMKDKRDTMEILPYKFDSIEKFYEDRYKGIIAFTDLVNIGIALILSYFSRDYYVGMASLMILSVIELVFLKFRRSNNYLDEYGMTILVCSGFVYFGFINYAYYSLVR